MQFLEDFTPELTIESPGRINIIGEHTDYNLGYVLPTAIEKKITLEFSKNNSDTECNVYTKGYDKGITIDLTKLEVSSEEWENYILGVLNEISKRSDKLRGFNCTIESNLPVGSGVSSSAALECGLAFGLNELFNLGLSKLDIVELSRDAEHTFVGTKCGIMDQYASVMSREGHVILLDCDTLDHTYIPIDIKPYKVLLLNTNVAHSLATSQYNVRREECETAVSIIAKKHPEVKSLRNATIEMIEEAKGEMSDKVYDRSTYVVAENNRVLAAIEALKGNDLKKLGELLYETHDGLSRLYEVSCPELDFLVEFSKGNDQVLGARLMGGGFGGCTINIVHEDAVDAYVKEASEAYEKKFNIKLTSFEALPSQGTSIKL